MKNSWAEYEANVQKKTDLLRQIMQLSLDEAACIEQDDVEKLAASLDERRKLMDAIDHLDMECGQVCLAGGAPVKIGSQRSAKSWKELLEQIQMADRENRGQAQKKLGQYRDLLRSLSQTRKGMNSYTQSFWNSNAIFFDIKK